MLVLYILATFAMHAPGMLPAAGPVKNPERDCPNFDRNTCAFQSLCVWECEESKCVQTSDANSACNPGMSPMGMPMHPYGAAPMGMPGQFPMNGMTQPGYGAMNGMTQPGYGAGGMRPGMSPMGMQPGYPQTGVPQAGYPGMAQPGYSQPGLIPGAAYPQAGMPPMAGAYPAQQRPGFGAAGYGAAPAAGYGATPYGARPGMTTGLNSAYPGAVRPGFGAAAAPMAATGFGHGAYGPMLRSVRKSNTTLQHTAYGAYPSVPGAYPQTYPARGGAYPRSRGGYPASGAYGAGAYGTNSNSRGIAARGVGTNPNYYGWQAPKKKKYNMSTTFSYALMIVTPFLILCSFCVGKFVGATNSLKNATPGNMISNPDLMQPIHLEPTTGYYNQMSSMADLEGPSLKYDPESDYPRENTRRSLRRPNKVAC